MYVCIGSINVWCMFVLVIANTDESVFSWNDRCGTDVVLAAFQFVDELRPSAHRSRPCPRPRPGACAPAAPHRLYLSCHHATNTLLGFPAMNLNCNAVAVAVTVTVTMSMAIAIAMATAVTVTRTDCQRTTIPPSMQPTQYRI